jgi:DNA-binding MarR family transcriptional regulator
MSKEVYQAELIRRVIDGYWKTIPPLWHHTRASVQLFAREEFGITLAQYHILRRIKEGRRSVSELSDCMFVSRPNISRAVEDLVNGGWAKRERNSQDRRNVLLSLTPKGQDLFRQMHARNSLFMRDLFASLELAELETIAVAFESLEKIMKACEPIKA